MRRSVCGMLSSWIDPGISLGWISVFVKLGPLSKLNGDWSFLV